MIVQGMCMQFDKYMHQSFIISVPFYLQIYIGNLRGTSQVLKNRDVLKELKVGMLVAYSSHNDIPNIARVINTPSNPTMDSVIDVVLFKQEKAPHKPRWLRYFTSADRTATVLFSEIILYDFELTSKGALRKKTRDFLKEI